MTKKQKLYEAKAMLNQAARQIQAAIELAPKEANGFAMHEAYDAYCKACSAAAWIDGTGKQARKK